MGEDHEIVNHWLDLDRWCLLWCVSEHGPLAIALDSALVTDTPR